MRIARVIGQQGSDLRLGDAVAHAGHRPHIGSSAIAERATGPQAVIGAHTVAVGQSLLHLADVRIGEREALRHHLGKIQQIGHHRVDLVGLERLGRVPGHGTADVVPQRGHARELHHGGASGERLIGQPLDAPRADVVPGGAAHDRCEHLVALAKNTVAGSALGLPDVHALRNAAAAARQTLEVGPDVDVPGGDLLGAGRAADPGVSGRGLGGRGRHAQGKRDDAQDDDRPPEAHARALRRAGHSSPRRSPEPARSGCCCCDRSSASREPRAAADRWAGHSRCRRWPGSG